MGRVEGATGSGIAVEGVDTAKGVGRLRRVDRRESVVRDVGISADEAGADGRDGAIAI